MLFTEIKVVYLADDDEDDCLLFQEVLNEIGPSFQLITLHDGEQLMKALMQLPADLPHVLFLDLNMPRKDGYQCLTEIRKNVNLKRIPVVAFTTSSQTDVIDQLYAGGAHYFIRKPSEFTHYKNVIQTVLTLLDSKRIGGQQEFLQPPKEEFVLYN